jgi:predicted XRE-type DNA-binding protein
MMWKPISRYGSRNGDDPRFRTTLNTKYVPMFAPLMFALRASRVPEEIKEGHRDAQGRNRLDRKTSERSDQGKGRTTVTKTPAAKDPTRNVWLQLGFPDAEEHFLKAELVLRLHKAINSLGLTQRAAARRIGTTQPELSKILGGKFTEVSLERLMRFLTARLSYRDQNWGRAGKQGRARHNQGCPTHGCVKRSRLLREGGWMRHPAALEEPRRRNRASYSGALGEISRRQALTLVAGVAAFVSGAHVTAQTSPSGGLATTEPSRVERTQAELDNNRRKTMSQTASTLSLRNLHDVFGEIDPVRRRAAIDEIFHEDAVFYEPNGAYRGRDEIDRIAGVIKATHPDFQYQPLSPPEEIGDGCRGRWVSGSPGKPPAYAGTDFIVVRDGKIAAVYLFFDKLPN